jgi:hypothetical protein
MLAPADHETLLELLRPPEGSRLDQAVGTTFALNLDALLIAPAAFALFEATSGREPSVGDLEPLGLLDSLRRHAQRITLFCQAGQIAPPPSHRRLLAYLEPSVIPVTAPEGGVFHPKVWLLRYRATDGARSSYRLVVLSRNLTHDRSWDTALRLESTDAATGTSLPEVGDFLAALPGLATGEVDESRRRDLAQLADDVRTIRWQLPDGFDTARFLPIGLGDAPVPPPLPASPDRLLVVSPFVGGGFLRSLPGTNRRLVSLPSWLQKVGVETLVGYDTYVLDDTADIETSGDEPADRRVADPRTELSGLHAKLYVAEAGDRTSVLTGSANATGAGWDRNVEAVVQLEGHTGEVGSITAMLDDRAETIAFGRLLLPYRVREEGDEQIEDPMAGEELDALRRDLAAVSWDAEVTTVDESLHVDLRTTGDLPPLPDDLEITVWPISIPVAERSPERDGGRLVTSFDTSIEGLTAFFALRLRRAELETQGVCKARLIGAPADRERRLLALLIGDAERFLHYLLLLLADASDRVDVAAMAATFTGEVNGQERLVVDDLPLLEAMLAAVAHRPDELEHVARLLDDLRAAPDADLVSTEFDQLWRSVWAAVEEDAR